MFIAESATTSEIVGVVLGSVLAALAVAVGTAFVHLFRSRAGAVRSDVQDMTAVTDYFFDKPADPRTRTPPKKGWTTKVDERLELHGRELRIIDRKLDRVLSEIGLARSEAASEVDAQRVERDRVHSRDDERGSA